MTADGSDRSFGAPRFDVVLRGYDRRQVDEHLSRLQRVLTRMRSDLEAARSRPPATPPPGARPRPSPRRRPGEPEPDVVGTFTDRMQTILQSAEDEAAEIRSKARSEAQAEEERLAGARASARTEEEKARSQLVHLLRQRDAVLADLTRVRGQLEALLAAPTARISVPSQDATTAAAARRDAGAGHPLPGTPAAPARRPGAPAAPPPMLAPGPGRPGAAATTVVPAGGAEEAPVGAAERTQFMVPVRRDETPPAERTVAVARPTAPVPEQDAVADEAPGAAPPDEPPADADPGPEPDGPAAAEDTGDAESAATPDAPSEEQPDAEPSDRSEPASATRPG